MTHNECRKIHRRLAAFTATRPPIKKKDGRCQRQISRYVVADDTIYAIRCSRKLGHESPHRFRRGHGMPPCELKFKKLG